jgi:hypothetical protein
MPERATKRLRSEPVRSKSSNTRFQISVSGVSAVLPPDVAGAASRFVTGIAAGDGEFAGGRRTGARIGRGSGGSGAKTGRLNGSNMRRQDSVSVNLAPGS